MFRWEDLYHELRSAHDEQQLFDRITEHAGRLGFEYCCYGVRMPLPISNPVVKTFDSYPQGWMAHYQKSDFLRIDPTVRMGMKSSDMIVWSDDTFASTKQLWADARDFGLLYGVAQSTWAEHNIFGLLTLSRSLNQVTHEEASYLIKQIHWLMNLSHNLMSQFLIPKLAPESHVGLTAREREILRWTAEGKTAYEIGGIMNISMRTVNFHVNNILQKTYSTNKTQAVVKAISAGLIDYC